VSLAETHHSSGAIHPVGIHGSRGEHPSCVGFTLITDAGNHGFREPGYPALCSNPGTARIYLMKIILTSLESSLTDAWKKHCSGLEGVEVKARSILKVKCDAVVSPANSFGFMDGGIDYQYTKHFGPRVQERLQELIRARHHGELLVGAAEIIETGDKRIPYLIAAPTMRVPMILAETVSPYLAARAALLLVTEGAFASGTYEGCPVSERVGALAFPGLGTGIGRVSADVCARQVRAAIEDVCLGETSFPASWSEAQTRHQHLYTGEIRDLQKDRDTKDLGNLIRRSERLKRRLRRQREIFQDRWKP
jgi:O-acetyl-ADP-ribose deacetylase (regulator of RNase III)